MENENKSTNFFTIDFMRKRIIGTKASFNKASKGAGDAYSELTAKIAAHPDYKLIVKTSKHKSVKKKRTYDGLDFDFMESYISIQPDAEAVMREYEEVKRVAVACGTSIYPFIKKWFLGKYSSANNPFDMTEAREAINNARLAAARSAAVA